MDLVKIFEKKEAERRKLEQEKLAEERRRRLEQEREQARKQEQKAAYQREREKIEAEIQAMRQRTLRESGLLEQLDTLKRTKGIIYKMSDDQGWIAVGKKTREHIPVWSDSEERGGYKSTSEYGPPKHHYLIVIHGAFIEIDSGLGLRQPDYSFKWFYGDGGWDSFYEALAETIQHGIEHEVWVLTLREAILGIF